jgi:hypothetical protein
MILIEPTKRLLVIASMFAVAHIGFAQKTAPLGSMVVLPNADPNIEKQACWKDANVLGVLLRVGWRDVETSDGAYDWTYFTTGIQLASANKKWVVLSIDGSRAPNWLYNEGVPMWTSSEGKHAPYPWNSTVQSKWAALIAGMGSQFDGASLVQAVTMWAGGTAIESFFAVSAADANKLDNIAGGGRGSGAILWENAAKTLINDFLGAFPDTPLYLATGICYPDNDAAMTDLANWFLSQSSAIRGMQSDALSTFYPSAHIFPHTTLNSASLSPIMYQELAPIGSARMKGGTLEHVINHGESQNAKAVQVYPGDPAKDETALADFNAHVGAN